MATQFLADTPSRPLNKCWIHFVFKYWFDGKPNYCSAWRAPRPPSGPRWRLLALQQHKRSWVTAGSQTPSSSPPGDYSSLNVSRPLSSLPSPHRSSPTVNSDSEPEDGVQCPQDAILRHPACHERHWELGVTNVWRTPTRSEASFGSSE